MHYVKAHVSRPHLSEKRIHVGPVIVQKAAAGMDKFRYFPDFGFKEPESIGVSHHDAGDRIIKKRLQVIHINCAVRAGLHLYHLQSAYGSACRIGAVGAVRDNHLRPAQVIP